jgi:peptide-methionine (S)-S-oxide reductase
MTYKMTEKIHFAAGCFWSVELAFQREPGVLKTTVGYTQGETKDPSYQDVCTGKTNHVETVQVEYDSKETSLDKLLYVFWAKHDATQKDGHVVEKETRIKFDVMVN